MSGDRVAGSSNSFDPMFATMRARKRAKSSCSIAHSIGLTRPSDMVVSAARSVVSARIIRIRFDFVRSRPGDASLIDRS